MSASCPDHQPTRLPCSTKLEALVRLAIGLGTLLAGILATRPAYADWKTVRQVTMGTSQVLEQGELTFGILGAPVAYGVSNRLTLQSHPILDLLLVPNVGGRYKVWEGESAIVSMTGSYKQSFFSRSTAGKPLASSTSDQRPCNRANVSGFGGSQEPTSDCFQPAPDPPGELALGPVATWYVTPKIALSVSPLYAVRLGTETGESTGHGIAVAAEAHVLVRAEDLLIMTVFQRYAIGSTAARPDAAGVLDPTIGQVAWVHQFRRFWSGVHLVAGVQFGKFPLGDVLGNSSLELPIFPTVDLWWRR